MASALSLSAIECKQKEGLFARLHHRTTNNNITPDEGSLSAVEGKQREELLARLLLIAEAAQHHTRHRAGVRLLHPAHHHAKVAA